MKQCCDPHNTNKILWLTAGEWSGTNPAAQRALHQKVFVSGVELRRSRRLEVWLQKSLSQRGDWERRTDSAQLSLDEEPLLLLRAVYLLANWQVWCKNPQAAAPLHQGLERAQCWSPSGPRPPWVWLTQTQLHCLPLLRKTLKYSSFNPKIRPILHKNFWFFVFTPSVRICLSKSADNSFSNSFPDKEI